jgi:hypothetical protein
MKTSELPMIVMECDLIRMPDMVVGKTAITCVNLMPSWLLPIFAKMMNFSCLLNLTNGMLDENS